ncbi:MAG: GNAT family N-acetyltransferase [Candidatus Bathyarchaeia archaeon]
MPIEICEYKAEDVDDTVKQLWLSLAREMFKIEHFILPSEANADKWIKFIRDSLAGKKSFLFVAKRGNKPIGFAHGSVLREYPLEVSEFAGTINDLYVSPEFRGKGIGKKLVFESLNRLKAEGVKVVRLMVVIENMSAVKLYEKFGFKIYQYGMMKVLRQ